jgi:hypothetical protein
MKGSDFRTCGETFSNRTVTWKETHTSVKQDHSGAGSDHHNATDRQLSALKFQTAGEKYFNDNSYSAALI